MGLIPLILLEARIFLVQSHGASTSRSESDRENFRRLSNCLRKAPVRGDVRTRWCANVGMCECAVRTGYYRTSVAKDTGSWQRRQGQGKGANMANYRVLMSLVY